ncbi:MAG: addiction module protein [Verrucomicrobiales bacterium]|nr:addiction module protein [Verrucomicrobiales bacterium]
MALERKETMSYTETMTIEHQIVTDEDGQPTAAIIPWDQFQRLQAMHASLENDKEPISDEFRDELNRRVQGLKDGTNKGIPHEEAMADLRSIIDKTKSA